MNVRSPDLSAALGNGFEYVKLLLLTLQLYVRISFVEPTLALDV